MGNRRKFDIAFVGLKPGIHEFNYEVDEKFFTDYQQADPMAIEFNNCDANIKLKLEKNTSFMMLKFESRRQCKCYLRQVWKYVTNESLG